MKCIDCNSSLYKTYIKELGKYFWMCKCESELDEFGYGQEYKNLDVYLRLNAGVTEVYAGLFTYLYEHESGEGVVVTLETLHVDKVRVDISWEVYEKLQASTGDMIVLDMKGKNPICYKPATKFTEGYRLIRNGRKDLT